MDANRHKIRTSTLEENIKRIKGKLIESEIKKMTFIHDCDLTDGNIIAEKLPNAIIKFYPNH